MRIEKVDGWRVAGSHVIFPDRKAAEDHRRLHFIREAINLGLKLSLHEPMGPRFADAFAEYLITNGLDFKEPHYA